LPYNSED